MISMEITVKNPVPSTDESIQLTIPRTPSIPSTFPSPPHSTTHHIAQIQAIAEMPAQNRLILEPMPPSKRAA